MTEPINLTDFIAVSELESDTIVAYEQLLSKRKKQMRYRREEIDALARLVELCELSASNSKNLFNGFAYSYRIPQISKEFDLLKIANDRTTAIDIELKSKINDISKVKKQLLQNRHYLTPVVHKSSCFCFCSKSNQLYTLDQHDEIIETDTEYLLACLR